MDKNSEKERISNINNIKSDYILKRVFQNMEQKPKLKLVNHNKKLQKRLKRLNLDDYKKEFFNDISSSKHHAVKEDKIKNLDYNDFEYLSDNDLLEKLPINFLDIMGKSPVIGAKEMLRFIYVTLENKATIDLCEYVGAITREVLDQFDLDDWRYLAQNNMLNLFSNDIINIMAKSPNMGQEKTIEIVVTWPESFSYSQLENISQELLKKFAFADFVSFTANETIGGRFRHLPDNTLNVMAKSVGSNIKQMVDFIVHNNEDTSEKQLKALDKEIIINFSLDDLNKLAYQTIRCTTPIIISKLKHFRDDLIEIIVNELKDGTREQRLDFVSKHWDRFSKEQREYTKEHGIDLKNPNYYDIKQNDKNNNLTSNSLSIKEQKETDKKKDNNDMDKPK